MHGGGAGEKVKEIPLDFFNGARRCLPFPHVAEGCPDMALCTAFDDDFDDEDLD
jgi:hypothetical protein